MIKAAVCCDDAVMKRIICDILKKIITKNGLRISVTEEGSPSPEDTDNFPEMIIIDDKFCSNGFEAAAKMRKNGCESEIIFLLSIPDEFIDTFDFAPAACIIKPIIFEETENAVTASVRHLISSEIIEFRTHHNHFRIMADDIIYIEAQGRNTNIRTVSAVCECTESISEISERLSEHQFIRTHRTYILNMRHISDIQDNLIYMSNGEIVVLSKNRKNDFHSALKKYRNKYSLR